MRGKSVCLSVCQPPLAPSLLHGREPRLRRLSPWALGTCPPPCLPPAPTSSLRGGGWVAGSSFLSDSVKFVSIVFSFVVWQHLVNDGHLTVQFSDCPDLPRRPFLTSQPKASRPAMNFIVSGTLCTLRPLTNYRPRRPSQFLALAK